MDHGRITIENNAQNRNIIEVLKALDLPIKQEENSIDRGDLVVIFKEDKSFSDNTLVIDNDKLSFYRIITLIVESYIKLNRHLINFNQPIIEGESKKFYLFNKRLALIELKPTMYSFTHNRYGVVEETDIIRLRFWRLFATMLNENFSNHILGIRKDKLIDEIAEKYISKNCPFVSNYLGEVSFSGKRYSIVKFADEIPPLEIIWKNYLVGTMKHNLKTVNQHETKDGNPIEYESKFPKNIIRFDWRNPLPDKDECIPDEFADFYIDSKVARKIARIASLMLNRMLQSKDYELVDLCYFMNYQGNMIHSEITPDGMRIKKKGKSFDKDLWRQGKDKATIVRVWNELYEDLANETT